MSNGRHPVIEDQPGRALDQENNRQSPNGLKKTHDFHIRVLLLKSVTG
jgi:hypothetical protein